MKVEGFLVPGAWPATAADTGVDPLVLGGHPLDGQHPVTVREPHPAARVPQGGEMPKINQRTTAKRQLGHIRNVCFIVQSIRVCTMNLHQNSLYGKLYQKCLFYCAEYMCVPWAFIKTVYGESHIRNVCWIVQNTCTIWALNPGY